MANQVQVDELDIDRQFEILEMEGEAADNQAEQALHDAVHEPESWLPGAAMLVDIVDAKLCPNWALSQAEKQDLAGTVAKVLDKYFPGAIAGFDNWHPLLQLGFAGSAIAVQRFDWNNGTFKPMHPPQDDDSDDNNSDSGGRPPDGGDGREPLGENGLRFATGAQ